MGNIVAIVSEVLGIVYAMVFETGSVGILVAEVLAVLMSLVVILSKQFPSVRPCTASISAVFKNEVSASCRTFTSP